MAASTPSKTLPQGCTNLKLRQFMRRVSQFYDAEMAPVGLKTTQYSLLSWVDKIGPVRPGELAEGMKMDASTLTRNLRPLVDAGWVVVSAGEDARSRLVSLTPAGREKRAEAKRRWKVAQEGINRLLGVEQVVALHALIDASMEKLDPVEDTEDGDV
ncbi:MarR family winged helix-turn-helix transcriptional regulator [Hydrogenophaga sp.]|uniref:MarR family winged helix-turn-helix transcriptional regulator n=1 Tax=Hydrogenophaga sp. TaxID=1904254 RepID=UPI0035B22AB8